MRRFAPLALALVVGMSVGWIAARSPAVAGHAPESFELSMPGRGPHPVKLVPVMEDTGEEFRVLSPADPRAETWRVTVTSGGRARTFVVQAVTERR